MVTPKHFWNVTASLLVALFALSLFSNISHPLLWNDESETAMYGLHVSEYGYPKIHDSQNRSLYLLPDPIATLQKFDAYIGTSWGQFYVGAIGVEAAKTVRNIFWKTALVRIPFAFAGFAGVCLLGLLFSRFFEGKRQRIFQSLFFLFELLSISLVLHLREARYYPLVVLSIAVVLWVFIRHNYFQKYKAKSYHVLMVGSLLLAFFSFYPLYFAFVLTFLFWEVWWAINFLVRAKFKINFSQIRELISPASYLLVSVVITIPLLLFFKNFEIAEFFRSRAYTTTATTIWENIKTALIFFNNFEFLSLYIAAKVTALALFFLSKKPDSHTRLKLKISNFLTLFAFCYLVAVSNVPFFFERYYIGLQPILTIILLFDINITYELLSPGFHSILNPKRIVFMGIFATVFVSSLAHRTNVVQGHIYEMFHAYRGPLDYAIPYIQDSFGNTKDLGVATDYEELSLMYYLDSRTIIGQYPKNIPDEQQGLIPDVIIPRKQPFSEIENSTEMYKAFFTKANYRKVALPVATYPYNNIPEIMYSSHLFKTFAPTPENTFTIFIRDK